MASNNFLQQYEKGEVRTAWLFIAPLLLVVGVFVLLPVLGTFYTSLFLDVSYLPKQFVGLRNYINLLSSPDFWQALRFTLAYTVAAVTLEAFFGVMFALLLNETFPGRGLLRVVILIPWAIPTIVSARTWQLIYEYTYGVMNFLVVNSGLVSERINWMGTEFGAFWALVFADVWKTTPFVVLILLAGLQAIPEDIYQQAKVDGAGMFRRFYKITLPMLMPVLMISLIFRTIDSLRMFDLVYVLTGGGPGGSTRTLSYLGFEAFANDNFGMGSSISVITFIVAFAITLVYLRAGKFSGAAQMTREKMIKSFLIFATSLFLLAFTLGPFIWMIWISLADRADFLVTGKVEYSFSNYYQVLTAHSLHFLDYLYNSLFVSTVTAVIVTLFSSMAAYAVSRMRFPGRSVVPLLILAMSMFPQISIVGYLFEMFAKAGLINSHVALILPYIAWTIPIALWINMSYFAQIPLDLDRAALVDGAGRMKVLYKIIFPLALPGIFSSALLVFIACFNEFLFAIMLTIDYTAQTLPVGIALFQGLHGEIPWGNLMAASAIASVPLVILTLIFQRYIVAGLMGGAVKG